MSSSCRRRPSCCGAAWPSACRPSARSSGRAALPSSCAPSPPCTRPPTPHPPRRARRCSLACPRAPASTALARAACTSCSTDSTPRACAPRRPYPRPRPRPRPRSRPRPRPRATSQYALRLAPGVQCGSVSLALNAGRLSTWFRGLGTSSCADRLTPRSCHEAEQAQDRHQAELHQAEREIHS